jgi:polysaccharide deacetylase family protein (PEP-CTERM system associated)
MNILTFDIEDWYNLDFISGNLNWDKYEVRIYQTVGKILEELSKRNLTATFFCLGWLAENHPNIIKEINSCGHHIGCHSYQHQLLSNFTREQFKLDTIKAKELIENVIGKEVTAYRAPGFSITKNNLWALEILVDLGFSYDCSIFSGRHDYGGFQGYSYAQPSILKLPNGTLKEFPINIKKIAGMDIVFSGGGYFRILPYFLIKKWSNDSQYLMTYFHPRDFDHEQPVFEGLPLSRRFKSYVGIKGAFEKFQTYLNDFDFVSILEADNHIVWEELTITNFTDKHL